MLHSLNGLISAPVIATDGEIGTAWNFLFDDRTWAVRYLVVETGHWLAKRKMLVAVSAIDPPDPAGQSVRVRLTRAQVRDSPGVDTEKPVARQQEIALAEHFGWTPYWSQAYLPSVPTHFEFPAGAGKGDPHLRSACELLGYDVVLPEHNLGRLDDFIFDRQSWRLSYLIVRTGDWLRHRDLLLPTDWVVSISWGRRRIRLSDAHELTRARSA